MENLANKNLSYPDKYGTISLPLAYWSPSSVADAVDTSYVFSVAHRWPTDAWWHIQCPTSEPPSKRTMVHRCDRSDHGYMDRADRPDTAAAALKECDPDYFPNIST